jgi:uncharacterized protein (DUF4415 family)
MSTNHDDDLLPEYDFSQGKRGLIRPHPGQTRISLWIDTDVLDAYMAYANRIGEDMTPAMNTALRQYIETLWAQTITSGEPPEGQADPRG